MPRPRQLDIIESRAQLARLERKHRGTSLEKRIAALRLLTDRPTISIADAAANIGVSKPTLDRWLASYRKGGLDALLTIRSPGRRRGSRARADASGSRAGTADLLLLLNGMPQTFDVGDAIGALRDGLKPLLPDIDLIVIAVDTACDLLDPASYSPTSELVQHAETGRPVVLSVRETVSTMPYSMSTLEGLVAKGFPIDRYHSPQVVDFHFDGELTTGCMLFLTELSRRPAGSDATGVIDSIRPFLEWTIANIILRHQHLRPQEQTLDRAFVAAVRQYRLTRQERRVLTYRLVGQSYKMIAGDLGISVDTVKKHLQSMYRKTGTFSLSEFFGKLFMPRLR